MQLPLNIDWQQILLHALNLVILVGGLYALLFKPVKKFMDQRAENYQKMKADAVLDSARNRAQKIVNDAMERAASEEKQIVQNAQSEIARLSVEATQKLMDCKLSDVYDQFLDAAEGSEAHDQR